MVNFRISALTKGERDRDNHEVIYNLILKISMPDILGLCRTL